MTAPQKRPSPFGPAVIGEKAAKRSAKIRQIRSDKFGPSVLGFKKKEPETPALASVPARKVVDAPPELPPPVADLTPKKKAEEYAGLSIKGVEGALDNNPDAFDLLFAAEQHRAEGARKGALRLLLKAEEAQDQPRAAILDQLETLLAP